MKDTRPLDNNEIRSVSMYFIGTFATRNRGLFILGVSTDGRISELLSLKIGDIYQNGKAVTDLLFEKSIVKGGEVSPSLSTKKAGKQLPISLLGIVSGTGTPKLIVRFSPLAQFRDCPFTSSICSPDAQESVYRRGSERQDRNA